MVRGVQVRPAAIVKRVANGLGFEIRRTGAGGSDPFAAQADLLAGTTVETIVDVGANRGDTVKRYRRLFPEARIFAFEPGQAAFSALQAAFAEDPLTHPQPVALAETEGERRFHLLSHDQTSSLLRPIDDGRYFDSHLTELVEVVEVPVRTVDAFCAAEGIDQVDILKLDVQGGELAVLQGATGLLSAHRIRLVFAEVLFAPLYERQAGYGSVATLLDGLGYRCFGLYDLRRGRNGMLVQADALYVEPAIEASLTPRW